MDQEVTQYFDSTESPIGPAQKGQVRAAVLHDLNEALARLDKLTVQGRNYIADTVKSPPGGTARAASGRYCSVRMGVSLTAPHRFLGMAVLDTLEHDDDAIFFGEPTQPLKRENTSNKRKRAFGQRPSVIVVRAKEVVLIDIVTRASLEKQEGTGIYERSGCNWTCPSAESSASQLGMRHEVWTENSIFTTRLTNNSILADYYAHPTASDAQLDRCAAISNLASERGAISIPQVLQELRLTSTIDDVFHAIANRSVYVDLGRCDLRLQHTVQLFANKSIGDAFYASQRAIAAASTWKPPTIELPKVNDFVDWDSIQYCVKNVGQDKIVLLCGEDYVELEIQTFRDLLSDGTILTFRTPDALAAARMEDASEHLLRASPKHLDMALKSLNAISPYLTGIKRSPGRTHRRYLQLYRDAEVASGNGFVGLIPGYGKSGNYFYFNAEALYTIVGQDIPVRYEPFDLSVVWGFVDGNWIPLKSRFERLLKGYTESELQLVCEELRKRRSNAEKDRLADTRIARALCDIHNHEALLLARKRALELQSALQSEFGPSRPVRSTRGAESSSNMEGSHADQPLEQGHPDDPRDDCAPALASSVPPRPKNDGGMLIEISELETY